DGGGRRGGLRGPGGDHFAHDVGAGGQAVEGVMAGAVGDRAGLARVEGAVVVRVEVDDHAAGGRFAGVLDAVAVEVVEGEAGDGGGGAAEEGVVGHGREAGVVEVIGDLGVDLRGVRR